MRHRRRCPSARVRALAASALCTALLPAQVAALVGLIGCAYAAGAAGWARAKLRRAARGGAGG